MPEIDVNVSLGPVQAITVLDTTVQETLASGRAALVGWSLRTTSVQSGQEVQGSQNAPAAGTTIVSLAMPVGEWTVSWDVMVSGTVGAAEIDNFQLLGGAFPLLNSVNGNTVGQVYQQPPVTVSIPAGGANLIIKNINAATAASVYTASISATPIGAVAIAEITSGGNPIAEISMEVGQTDTQMLTSQGVDIPGDITLDVISGSMRGAVYVRLY